MEFRVWMGFWDELASYLYGSLEDWVARDVVYNFLFDLRHNRVLGRSNLTKNRDCVLVSIEKWKGDNLVYPNDFGKIGTRLLHI
jgi:hypothetical protein